MVALPNILWVDSNVDGEENTSYIEELKSLNFYKIKCFKDINEAIDHIKTIEFEETIIIVSGNLYIPFIKSFKNNLNDIYVIPKIIIFTSNVEKFKNNVEYQNIIKHPFYNVGGLHDSFEKIKNFIINPPGKKKMMLRREETELIFEYIDCKEKLAFPMFYESLIEVKPNDNFEDFTKQLYIKYSKNNKEIEELLEPIINMQKIPLELLSKYYSRIYTTETDFYRDLNNDLRLKNTNNYLPYIKVLYEGVKLDSLSLSTNKKLYRGGRLSNTEINKINEFIKMRKTGLPAAIVFSKTFLSFTKDKKIAEYFLDEEEVEKKINSPNKLVKVLFILEKDSIDNSSFSTHADIEKKISLFPTEREVLFFPFSSFEIKNINERIVNNEKRYEIQLSYLGKYKKQFDLPKKPTIPDSQFKNELIQSGLIKPEIIMKNNSTEQLLKTYNDYKIKIYKDKKDKLNKKKQNNISNTQYPKKYILRRYDYEDISDIEKIDSQKNYIDGVININQNDINKNIRIINSFEDFKRSYPHTKVDNEIAYLNEKEIKDNCQITIDGHKIDFFNFVRFPTPKKYKIRYNFKNKLIKTDFMFAECSKLEFLDLFNFDARKVINMSCMFFGCSSLKGLILPTLKPLNVNNMNNMFNGCESLINLDLSFLKTDKVTNMSKMFYNCILLKNLNLSTMNTQNVVNMYCMFYNCKSLTQLNLSSFDTKNVKNMARMFAGCESLKYLDISNFNTENVIYMHNLFFKNRDLNRLSITKFQALNAANMEDLFLGCVSLKIQNIICNENIIKKNSFS